MKRLALFLILVTTILASITPCSAQTTDTQTLAPGVYAKFETSLGNFTARLYADKAPKTVQNFIDLTEGRKEYRNPDTGEFTKARLYDGRQVFRIVKGFMFQTGAASDENTYQSGFTISDEFSPDLTFSKPGILAMANTGTPNSSSCQFFVTTGAEWHFGDGKYSIFGEVVEGMDTVNKIDSVPVKANPMSGELSLPETAPVIKKVTIVKIGQNAPKKP
jgi:peptidyl-prolyl cis-trans isomerase A (cyclophilin A)